MADYTCEEIPAKFAAGNPTATIDTDIVIEFCSPIGTFKLLEL